MGQDFVLNVRPPKALKSGVLVLVHRLSITAILNSLTSMVIFFSFSCFLILFFPLFLCFFFSFNHSFTQAFSQPLIPSITFSPILCSRAFPLQLILDIFCTNLTFLNF